MGNAFYNKGAERAFLISLIKEKGRNKHAQSITPADFYFEDYGKIFAAVQMAVNNDKAVAIPMIAENLKQLYGSDDLMSTLSHMLAEGQFIQSWAIDSNAEIILKAAQRRNLHAALTKAREAVEDPKRDTADVLEEARQALRNINTGARKWHSLQDVLLSTFSELERRSKGEEPSVSSGIARIDKYTGGFHRGELVVIGARPAVGKSALGMHIALAAAANGHKVAACSREMADVQYGVRLLARETSVDAWKMRTGQFSGSDWDQITDALTHYGGMNIDFTFSARDIETLRAEVQNKVDTDGLDLLLVDYMQLMDSRKTFRTEYEQVSYVSKMLKDMTIDFNICVVALAQVGRSSDGTMPSLAELRGSGAIEQDADIVLFMHKPKNANDEYVYPDDRGMFDGALKSTGQEYVVLNIAKNRQGVTRVVPVLFNPARMQFNDIYRGMEGG